MTDKILYSPKEGTTGFWSNKLEIIGHIPGIVSGCEVGLMFLENGGAKLKPGDLFDLPEGYEFKEEEICGYTGNSCDVTCNHCGYDAKKVLRLVKTETKEIKVAIIGHGQPEPEESQHEMLTELLKLFTEFGYKKVLQNFIIQRKKQ